MKCKWCDRTTRHNTDWCRTGYKKLELKLANLAAAYQKAIGKVKA